MTLKSMQQHDRMAVHRPVDILLPSALPSALRHPPSILVHRIVKWMAGVALFALACSDPTAPLDFDIRQFPYTKSSTGVRLFGTSRVLVVPARFADGAAPSLSSSDIAAQLFSGAGGGP